MKIETTEKQLSFGFCSGCGSYLLPEQGKAVIKGGVPMVYCADCQDRQKSKQDTGGMDETDRQALEFAEKYNLPVDDDGK